MLWIGVFVGLAVLGLVVLAGCSLRVVRRASALMRELGVLGERAGALSNLMTQLGAASTMGSGDVSVTSPETRKR